MSRSSASGREPAAVPPTRVTIADVAREAGVRAGTVSKVLNSQVGSAETRARVQAAAALLRYHPRQQAQTLRTARSHTIGLLIPDLGNPAFLPLLRGVEHAAQEGGYVVVVADGQRSEDIQSSALQRLFSQGIDGLVLAGPVPYRTLRLYLEQGVLVSPSVRDYQRALARHWERSESAATAAMARRLLQLGHRRLAVVTTAPPAGGERYRRSRAGVLVERMTEAGGHVQILVVEPTSRLEQDAPAVVRFLETSEPTAVICANHLLAPLTLVAIRNSGLRVPDDVTVVLYGDSDWAQAYAPALSVVRQDAFGEGYQLAAALLRRIEGRETDVAPAAAAEFVERESCAPPPTGGRRHSPVATSPTIGVTVFGTGSRRQGDRRDAGEGTA